MKKLEAKMKKKDYSYRIYIQAIKDAGHSGGARAPHNREALEAQLNADNQRFWIH